MFRNLLQEFERDIFYFYLIIYTKYMQTEYFCIDFRKLHYLLFIKYG